jgi:hypothetical protein
MLKNSKEVGACRHDPLQVTHSDPKKIKKPVSTLGAPLIFVPAFDLEFLGPDSMSGFDETLG